MGILERVTALATTFVPAPSQALRSEEIFHGADTHTRGVERMVKSMDEIAKVAEGNAAAIDGVATTSQKQVASMTEVVASSKSLTELAERLGGALRRFETRARDGGRETGP